MKKRFVAAVLAALLCAGLVPSASAAFTDVTDPDNRGRVESVLSVLPLAAMLILFGGFDAMTAAGRCLIVP